jgi:hypothetical protein
MNARELAMALTTAVEAGDFETAASYLADDFQFTGSMMPGSFGVEEWKGMSKALKAGMPDLSYNFRIVDADETTARVSSQLSGTHTQDLDLSAMNMGVIPPTNVAFTCGEEFSVGQTRDGKIVSIHLEQNPDRGMFDMLRQIGVEVPQM